LRNYRNLHVYIQVLFRIILNNYKAFNPGSLKAQDHYSYEVEMQKLLDWK